MQPVVVFVLAAVVASTSGAGVDVSCFNKTDGFYSNPVSCEEYYICTMGRAYRFVCRPGHVYNPRTEKCDQAQNVKCHVFTPTAPSNTFSCLRKSDDFYPSPTACDQYYVCVNQTVFTVTCSYGLLYHPTKKYCDLRSKVTCLPGQKSPPFTTIATNLPMPTRNIISTHSPFTQGTHVDYSALCHGKSQVLLADPGNCRRYIQCYQQLAMVRHCPPATSFNVNIQACDFHNVIGCH